MRSILCLITFYLFICVSGMSQSAPTDHPIRQYATAYVTQPSSKRQPSIKIVYETGESEVILLEKYSSSEDRKAGGKKIADTDLDNQVTITAFINDLAAKNYSVKDIEYQVSSHNTKYTVILFEKVISSPKPD